MPDLNIDVKKEFREKNKMRIEPVPEWQLKQEIAAKPVYVYNVSKFDSWVRNVPGLGRITIPKCPQEQEVSLPIKVKGMVRSYFDRGNGAKAVHYDEGIHVARDLVGMLSDSTIASQNNLENWGVFIAEEKLEDLPKERREELITQANQRLVKRNHEYVLQADRYWRGDQRQRSYICQRHQEACIAVGLKREWSAAGVEFAVKLLACEACASDIKPGAAFCVACKYAVDTEKCARLKLNVVDGFVVIGGAAKKAKVE